MFKVKVNKDLEFDVAINNDQLLVNGQDIQLDMSRINSNEVHVIHHYQSYNTEIIEVNRTDKTCKIKVNGCVYEVSIEDQFDQLLKQLGLDNLTTNRVSEIKAPMPGLVLKVIAEENKEVKKGDNLIVLEAMKMENILKSPTDGVIKKINVKQGDKVEKNQILIQFT